MAGKKIKKDKKLLPRHEVFVRALAAGKDRADAYIEAYPKSAKSSRDRVARTAYQLLQRPEIMSAYQAELEKHRAEEERRNRWTYERSVQARLEALDAIAEERNRRRTAQETMATAMMEHPPEGLSPEEIVLKAQEILMQPILTAQTTSAVAQLCDGLDKLTGLMRDEGSNQMNVFITSDPWDKP
ncbi:MAG: hypothetical protein IIY06_01580 [Proteobacteria bacterium]|nr:hypothetical protein [Pseudomonadota bacterium]